MKVFFYGLFMDEALLAGMGVFPSCAMVGYLDGFALRIGERATLQRSACARSYGVMMSITADEARRLYAEDSVADYVPESVTVALPSGRKIEAVVYNLPAERLTGTNEGYVESLRELADRLGFPDSYLAQIR